MDDNQKKSKRNRENSQSRPSSRKERSRSPVNRKITWKSGNAFINFMQDFRTQNPDVKNPNTFKMAGEKWRDMTPSEKQPYVDAADSVKQKNKENGEKLKKSAMSTALKKEKLKLSNQKKLELKSQDVNEGSTTSMITKTEKAASGNESVDDQNKS